MAPRRVAGCINTVLCPLPSAARCWKLGQTVGHAIAGWNVDANVLVPGAGGLSHQLEGGRAGHLNPPFDLRFMDSLTRDPGWATRTPINDLVKEVGTQGIELLTWLAACATLPGRVHERHRNDHIPISNTAAGLLLFENG